MSLRRMLCLAGVICFLSLEAFAHVGLSPREGTAGALHQFFKLRAPVEKEIPTTELKIEIPPEWKAAGGKVNRVHLDPTWKVSIEKDSDDWIKSVTWSGGEAPEWAYVEFGIVLTLPKLQGLQQFKAYQKYSDGSVVAWIEDANMKDVEKPAARLTLHEGGPEGEEAGGVQRAGVMSGPLSNGVSGLLGAVLGAALVAFSRRNNKYPN